MSQFLRNISDIWLIFIRNLYNFFTDIGISVEWHQRYINKKENVKDICRPKWN